MLNNFEGMLTWPGKRYRHRKCRLFRILRMPLWRPSQPNLTLKALTKKWTQILTTTFCQWLKLVVTLSQIPPSEPQMAGVEKRVAIKSRSTFASHRLVAPSTALIWYHPSSGPCFVIWRMSIPMQIYMTSTRTPSIVKGNKSLRIKSFGLV